MTLAASTYSRPVVVTEKGIITTLRRVGLDSSADEARHREDFLQELVHSQPSIIPMHDIEPAYTPLISVCRELETPAGFLDNLWITPEGGIVLGECKLARNPQARREVVAQALDYARAVSSWGFEDLERGSAEARKEPEFKLWKLCLNTLISMRRGSTMRSSGGFRQATSWCSSSGTAFRKAPRH